MQELGRLERLVLFAVGRSPSAYGMSVKAAIYDATGGTFQISLIYQTLKRLEAKGLLKAYMADAEPVRGGRAKRCYRLTPKGKSSISHALSTMQREMQVLLHLSGADA